ncbi:hypothetical protein H0E87_013981 [Populus deltoides]|uniref:Terpene synthase metal-binding domain-containing protein n=1 Tax=Populus deltoides TaxID=3696 RepID=A0A8T2YBP7_POPDE|nr:hypothetical protein H0E87_013981 [Populus deltoides]
MALCLFTNLPSVNSMNWKDMPRHPLPRAAHRTCINLQFTCSGSLKESHEVSKRRLANYQPTTWSCDFLQSLKNDNADKIYKDKAMELEEEWADLCKAFLQEAKWSYNNITPSFEEYLENAWRSVSGTVILIHAFFLMGENISKQALDYLVNYDELLRWPSIIFRLSNDLATSSAEIARGETANSISCYMYETGASEVEARKQIEKLIQKAWRNMNKCQIDKETPFARSFVGTAINLARIAQCTYQHGDGHGAPDSRCTRTTKILDLLTWAGLVGPSEAEIARGETANSISCYMYETGASEAEARKHTEKLIQKAWRNMNKCQIDNETPFARSFVGTAINLARIAQCTYQHGDGHGAPDSRSKNRISSLIIEPISFH